MRRAALVCVAAAGCKQLFGLEEPVVRDGGGGGSGDARVDVPIASPDGGRDAIGIDAPGSTIVFRQYHFGSGTGNSFAVNYTAQQAGDLNVVVIGWQSNALLTSLTDSAGNVYSVASQVTSGSTNQMIYYCCDIVASNSNLVTAQFSQQTNLDLRVLEYSGLRTLGCYDGQVQSSGTSTAETSSALQTSSPLELLVAANTTTKTTTSADPMFTNRGVDAIGDLVEDRIVTATGTYTASATQNTSGTWVMQMVAFVGQ